MVIRYPITSEVRNALQRFPRIAEEIRSKLLGSGRSELEIVRWLGNTHYKHIESLLAFVDNNLPASGSIGKRVLEQTDLLHFHRALSEFDLLAHLQDAAGVENAQPASAPPGTKHGDIDLTVGSAQVRVEIYCPAEFFGYQLVRRYLSMMFKYLEVDVGFEVTLHLENRHLEEPPFFNYDIKENDARTWLAALSTEVGQWITNAQAGEQRLFQDPTESLLLSVKIDVLHSDPACRLVAHHTSMQSYDTKLFFDEMGTPESTAQGQWGRKLLYKLQKRQCGEAPSPESLRLLVVDFSLADTGWPDFICYPNTAKRLAATLDLLVDEAGPPLPYDAVLPAQLSRECGFGKIISLDKRRTEEIERVVQAASFNRPCKPHNAGDQKKHMEEMRRFAASRQHPVLSNQNIKDDPDFQELLDSISALEH